MAYYINFFYKNLSYDEKIIMGHFSVWPGDGDVECDFIYDRINETFEISNSNKPEEEILSLPIGWLLYKLKTQGYLKENESKISY